MKMRIKPLVVDVIEDDGMYLEPYTMTYFDKDSLESIDEHEVDLEKEIIEAEKKYGDINEMGGYEILLFDDEFRDILRHFYELGLNTRKEE